MLALQGDTGGPCLDRRPWCPLVALAGMGYLLCAAARLTRGRSWRTSAVPGPRIRVLAIGARVSLSLWCCRPRIPRHHPRCIRLGGAPLGGGETARSRSCCCWRRWLLPRGGSCPRSLDRRGRQSFRCPTCPESGRRTPARPRPHCGVMGSQRALATSPRGTRGAHRAGRCAPRPSSRGPGGARRPGALAGPGDAGGGDRLVACGGHGSPRRGGRGAAWIGLTSGEPPGQLGAALLIVAALPLELWIRISPASARCPTRARSHGGPAGGRRRTLCYRRGPSR